ncbi:MAG TPA: hypothetical protein VF800_28800 [Telluria sp.]|jgi:hypothetical protein
MDNRERLQGSGRVQAARGSCWAPQTMLDVSVPPALRAIFHVWSQPSDPAPMLPRGGDMQALVAAYQRLGESGGTAQVERELLVRVYVNAALNGEFALWTELRHEAAAVLRWLAPIVAADPLLRARVAQAWPCGPDAT